LAVAASRNIIIAGAGIGGLTAALALVRQGYRVVVLEAARALAEIGAGIQLSPNATRVLQTLGVTDRLRGHAVAPQAISVLAARSAREIVRIPLGPAAERRYDAPYWVVHRADLQNVLLEALEGSTDFTLRLGFTVRDVKADDDSVAVGGKTLSGVLVQERGAALIGADGLWSTVRTRLWPGAIPRFRDRIAWRATVDASRVAAPWREPVTRLWLGRKAHLVHYAVRARAAVNLVAITQGDAKIAGWNGQGSADALAQHFARWAEPARELLATVDDWQTWSLYDLPPLPEWGRGAVTLLGDAAHAMLPFLAQGGAMAIEDAAVLARCVASADAIAPALRAYEAERQARTQRASQAAAQNGTIYHLGGPMAAARNLVMRSRGGDRLLQSYDWLYGWQTG
jgi:salicylate hydroxylase